MADVDVEALRTAIKEAGHSWEVRAVPEGEYHALGNLSSDPHHEQQAIATAERLVRARVRTAPTGGAADEAKLTIHAAGLSIPSSFDWRSRGVIGPVTDQLNCGSCVSFATCGLTAAMAAIELGALSLNLSEADQHFCSSHGASCGGWNNADSLGQIKTRGVSTEGDFTYMSAFDNPPVDDPSEPGNWVAHCRAESNRAYRTYKITDYSGWTSSMLGLPFDARKYYLANYGPLVCGFTVYQDFDHYAGGVYRHTYGNVRGGHAVLVIGYSDTEQCWICRNSWGAGFGGAAHPDGTGGGYFKIGYGDSNIDNEAFYGCHGVIPPATLPVVSGVSRSTDKLDVFAAGTNHGTYTAAWQPGDTSWQGWWQIQGGVAAPGTSIFPVSRSRDHLDVFAVGTDYGIYTAAWQPGDAHWQGWWPIQGGIAAPNTTVFAVSRSANKLDVFAVGTDGGVYTAAWQPGDAHWQGWWRIGTLKVAPNTSVYAVSRSTDHLDIFAVGEDHGIYTAAWQPGFTSWHGWWRIQGGVAAPNTSVFGVSRSTDHLDVFAVGTDHRIYTAAWQPGFTSWHGWWPIANGFAAAGTSVFGVSRSTDHLDVFAIGLDFGIYTAAWQPGWTGWHGWTKIAGGVAEGG